MVLFMKAKQMELVDERTLENQWRAAALIFFQVAASSPSSSG